MKNRCPVWKTDASARCRYPDESPLDQSLGGRSIHPSIHPALEDAAQSHRTDKSSRFLGSLLLLLLFSPSSPSFSCFFTCNGRAKLAFFSILCCAFRWCLQLNPTSLYIYRHVCLLLVSQFTIRPTGVVSALLFFTLSLFFFFFFFLWALPSPLPAWCLPPSVPPQNLPGRSPRSQRHTVTSQNHSTAVDPPEESSRGKKNRFLARFLLLSLSLLLVHGFSLALISRLPVSPMIGPTCSCISWLVRFLWLWW